MNLGNNYNQFPSHKSQVSIAYLKSINGLNTNYWVLITVTLLVILQKKIEII